MKFTWNGPQVMWDGLSATKPNIPLFFSDALGKINTATSGPVFFKRPFST